MGERATSAHWIAYWAGLATGPGAWAVSTQTQYSATPLSCAHGTALHLVTSLILAACAAAGGYFSYGVLNRTQRSINVQEEGEPRLFLARISILSAALFTLGILMQGAATLFLTGCQR